MEDQKLCLQQQRTRTEGRDVQTERLCQRVTAETGLISPDRSGGDVGVEIKCFHNRLCQRVNEASLGHTSGFATDQGKPEGTVSCEGRWHTLLFSTIRR